MKIYGIPTLNSIKVVLTAEQLDLDYELILMDFSKGEHKTPEHLQRHPLGKVPVIEHDGKTLFESNAICIYLAASSGSALWPQDVHAQGLVHQWIDMLSFHPGRWLSVHYFENFIKPRFVGGEADAGELEQADRFLDEQLPVVDRHLARQTWLCGEAQTVADLVGFAFFHTHEFSGYSFDQYPAITRWYQQIRRSEGTSRMLTRLNLPR